MLDLDRHREPFDSEAVTCAALLTLIARLESDQDPERTGRRLETIDDTFKRLATGQRRIVA